MGDKAQVPFFISDTEVAELYVKLAYLLDEFLNQLSNAELIPKARSIRAFEILESLDDPKERFVGLIMLIRVVRELTEQELLHFLQIEIIEDEYPGEPPDEEGGGGNDGSGSNGQPN